VAPLGVAAPMVLLPCNTTMLMRECNTTRQSLLRGP
jgi:hypothetical protein